MSLKLTRPIVFLDIEATGLDRENDRIVELSLYKIFPDGEIDVRTRRLNPTIPITPGATDVHGIKDEDVANEKTFAVVAKGLFSLIDGCDVGGFGSNFFDIPMLYNEFIRAGIEWDYSKANLIDIGNLFKIKEERSLSAAVKFYLNREHTGAHGAEADTKETVNVFYAMLKKYEDLPETMEELALVTNYGKKMLDLSGKFYYSEDGQIMLGFGKHKDKPAIENLDFIDWMYYKASFPPDTCKICAHLLGIPSSQNLNI